MDLPAKPTLEDYQALLNQLVIERGFDKETPAEVLMLLVEEVGEAAKALRKSSGLKVDNNSKKHELEEELADVFWLLLDLCNRMDIDLEKAFLDKEKKNRQRKWN